MNPLDLILGHGVCAACKVGADQIEDELGRVGVCWQRIANTVEIGRHFLDRTEVARLPAREEEQLIEKLECSCGRLMDTGDNDELPDVSNCRSLNHNRRTLLATAISLT